MLQDHNTPVCSHCEEPLSPDTHALNRDEEPSVFCPKCGWEEPNPDSDGPDALEAALHYAELGYPVLPIEPEEKRPHHLLAPRGLRDASRSHLILRAWFQAFPGCNLALVPPEGVAVLDFDDRDEADRFLVRFPELREAPISHTPRGAHLWLAVPVGAELRAKSPRGLPNFEVKRPRKAYLLEHPSKTPYGHYVWVNPLVRPSELPPMPLDLLRSLSVTRTSSQATRHGADPQDFERILLEFRVSASPGNRHNSLVSVASKLRAASAPAEVFERLALAAQELGLPPHEVRSALRWVQDTVQPQAKPAIARSTRSLFALSRVKFFGGRHDR